jgi:two-component system, LytTR family, response regulator
MSEIKCIIVEDEPLAAKLLTMYISKIPFLKLQGTFKDALTTSEYLMEHKIDLLFLDIHLPKLKGLSFLKTLNSPPAVILTTAYHQYAVEAFALNVLDYLVKPIEFDRFVAAINKLKTKSEQKNETKDHLFISVQKKKIKVLFQDILFIESQKDYIKLVTITNTYYTKMPTYEMEALLPTSLFCRIHRSFIISISKIDAYTLDQVEIKGTSIPIGKAYKNVISNL